MPFAGITLPQVESDNTSVPAVWADGLDPASDYWYKFLLVNGSEVSPTGHFR